MFIYWDLYSVDHIGKHNVAMSEVTEVIKSTRSPYPQEIGDDKFSAWGTADSGRYLQVIFVFRPVSQVDLKYVPPHQRLELESLEEVIYVIHARDLKPDEKRRFNRRRRL